MFAVRPALVHAGLGTTAFEVCVALPSAFCVLTVSVARAVGEAVEGHARRRREDGLDDVARRADV
jgi:hypothetical protein